MVVVPAESPDTNPAILTVATAVFDELHAFDTAGVAEPVNCVVPPTQADNVPLIAGKAVTVTVLVFEQPLLLV